MHEQMDRQRGGCRAEETNKQMDIYSIKMHELMDKHMDKWI